MKKCILLLTLVFLTAAQNVAKAQGQELTVSDIEDSGCLSEARGPKNEPVPTIILTKEGDILSVQCLNYESNCATVDFIVKSNVSEGSDGAPSSLNISVAPYLSDIVAACMCPYNVSFTVHDLNDNSFYLTCWWYEGLVNLTDGEPLVLEDIMQDVTLDETKYTLRKAMGRAMLKDGSAQKGEFRIPSELNYDGQTYTVTSIYNYAYQSNTNLTKVIVPSTIINMDLSGRVSFTLNPFGGCTYLEWIEVEEGNPAICSMDGVLFNKDKTRLLGYPAGARRTSYTIPEEVTWIEGCSFYQNPYIKKVTMSDEVTALGYSAFYGCNNLEEVRLSSQLQTIAGWTFGDCPRLKSVTIPEGVTYIGPSSFHNCSALKTLDLPESVCRIDKMPFAGCKLNSLYIRGIIEPQCINRNLFEDMDTQTKVYVQPSEVEKFQAVYRGKVYPITDETQGIVDTTHFTATQSTLYDLSGRRVSVSSVLPKGVYIQNGKKFVVK